MHHHVNFLLMVVCLWWPAQFVVLSYRALRVSIFRYRSLSSVSLIMNVVKCCLLWWILAISLSCLSVIVIRRGYAILMFMSLWIIRSRFGIIVLVYTMLDIWWQCSHSMFIVVDSVLLLRRMRLSMFVVVDGHGLSSLLVSITHLWENSVDCMLHCLQNDEHVDANQLIFVNAVTSASHIFLRSISGLPFSLYLYWVFE